MPVECRADHPTSKWSRCIRNDGHDGPHRCFFGTKWPSERDSAALTSETADAASSSLSVDSGARAVHPVVARVLAKLPQRFDGVCALDDCALANTAANSHEYAAAIAAEVLRWLAQAKRDGEQGCWCHRCLDDLADELDPKETNP